MLQNVGVDHGRRNIPVAEQGLKGEQEGGLIGNLTKDLVASTDSRDLHGFVAVDGELMVGAIFLSRLTFEKEIDVFTLAPVAVYTEYQGMGIGHALITHGDPAFYSKVGFHPLSQNMIEAPL